MARAIATIETPSGVVETVSPSDDPRSPLLSGQRLIFGGMCQYGEHVKAEDVLYVDFDRNRVVCDGLHLIEMMDGDRVKWMGCRRFSIVPDGAEVDWSGRGEWMPVTRLPSGRIVVGSEQLRVAGYVKQVYKPVEAVRR